MNALEPGPSVAPPPSPRSVTGPSPPGPTAEPGRSRLWTPALAGTVVLAIGGGVLLTMLYHSFANAKAPAAANSANEANRPANASEVKDRSLETMGSLTAAHLYQGFLNIGLLADARESEVYTEAEAEKLLDSVTRMLDTVDRRLARMLDDSMNEEDKEAVEHARQLGGLLRTQARELRAYWQTGDKEHADKFQKARQKSWSGIQAVLGIED
jgi:hypothetical protein